MFFASNSDPSDVICQRPFFWPWAAWKGWRGMIGVDTIGEIRRAYFEEHRPIKEIVRTLSVSRATVRKVVGSHKTEHRYERAVQPTPKLGEWVEVLTAILEKEAGLPRRERRSTQRLFEELRGRGYDGAHDSVHRFVMTWRDERARVAAQAYVPMSFAPGEAYQFDWSHETITLRGLPLTVKAAYMKAVRGPRFTAGMSSIRPVAPNRQARLSERRNHLDLQINLLAEQESTETLRLLRAVASKLGVEAFDAEEGALEQTTKPDAILKEIERRIE
jgi:hypothetical protein